MPKEYTRLSQHVGDILVPFNSENCWNFLISQIEICYWFIKPYNYDIKRGKYYIVTSKQVFFYSIIWVKFLGRQMVCFSLGNGKNKTEIQMK